MLVPPGAGEGVVEVVGVLEFGEGRGGGEEEDPAETDETRHQHPEDDEAEEEEEDLEEPAAVRVEGVVGREGGLEVLEPALEELLHAGDLLEDVLDLLPHDAGLGLGLVAGGILDVVVESPLVGAERLIGDADARGEVDLAAVGQVVVGEEAAVLLLAVGLSGVVPLADTAGAEDGGVLALEEDDGRLVVLAVDLARVGVDHLVEALAAFAVVVRSAEEDALSVGVALVTAAVADGQFARVDGVDDDKPLHRAEPLPAVVDGVGHGEVTEVLDEGSREGRGDGGSDPEVLLLVGKREAFLVVGLALVQDERIVA